MKQFYHCGLYQYQPTIVWTYFQPKLAVVWSPLIATWRLQHRLPAKQLHSDSRHCGKNTTARSQDTAARRSDFEMLLTNAL